ncbi:hypothetical protein LXL04_003502 [Taraxacum kok-saghyz]
MIADINSFVNSTFNSSALQPTKQALKVPIYFSAGLTIQANLYYKVLINWTSQKVKDTYATRNAFDFKNVHSFDRSLLDAPGPCVLFATPGMISGGFSLEVFKHWAPCESNLITLPGFLKKNSIRLIFNFFQPVAFDSIDYVSEALEAIKLMKGRGGESSCVEIGGGVSASCDYELRLPDRSDNDVPVIFGIELLLFEIEIQLSEIEIKSEHDQKNQALHEIHQLNGTDRYCVAGTVGHKLMSGKPTKVDLDKDTQIDVRCQIHPLSFSPHTDAKGIMERSTCTR